MVRLLISLAIFVVMVWVSILVLRKTNAPGVAR